MERVWHPWEPKDVLTILKGSLRGGLTYGERFSPEGQDSYLIYAPGLFGKEIANVHPWNGLHVILRDASYRAAVEETALAFEKASAEAFGTAIPVTIEG